MAFDYSKLRGKIIEVFSKQGSFAKAMQMSEHTLSLKMNNKVFFTQKEIKRASDLLNIPYADINEYFFKEKV